MKSRHTFVLVVISLLIGVFLFSGSLAVQASPLPDKPEPPKIEQPERPIYDPLYFETHRLPGAIPASTEGKAPDYGFIYSATAVQNLDEYDEGKYNYEIYYYGSSFNTNLTNYEDANDVYPRLNPGCTHIVFTSDRTGNLEVFSMTTDGGNLTQLTWDNASDVRPDWSPDSGWLVWESYRDGQAEIYIQTYYAGNVTRLTQDDAFDGMPAWSPDGSKIAFVSYRTGGYRIYTMNTDGSGLTQLSDQPYSYFPVWSPDGSKIAFSADADSDGWLELWTMNSDGSNEQLLYDTTAQDADVIANAWAPNEPVIAYTLAEYVYVYGDWYWERANINGWNYAYNYGADIYGTSMAWNLDWQTTDNMAPTSAVIEPSSGPQPYRFLVQWTGYDDKSGIKKYEVQVRDGVQGEWVDLQIDQNYTYVWFEGRGGHTYYFRSRAYDAAGNVEAWPADYDIAVAIETSAPVTTIDSLPRYSSQEYVYFHWDGYDPGDSGVRYFGIDKWDDISLKWTTWFTSEWSSGGELYGTPGHTYKLRSWGVDWAGNLEEQSSLGDVLTTFYGWMAVGRVTDNTGVPVEEADVFADEQPFQGKSSDLQGDYKVYFKHNPEEKSFTFSKSQYAVLPPSLFGSNVDIAADFVLPPADNVVQDWGFEDNEPSTAWNVGGVYTTSLATSSAHSGEQAASLGSDSAYSEPYNLEIKPNLGNKLSMKIGQDHVFHIAEIGYTDRTYIFYRQRQSDNTWLPLEVVDKPTLTVDNLVMAVDSHNIVHLLWKAYNAGTMYAVRDTDGTWSEPQLLFSGDSAPQDLLVDESGTLHLLLSWNDAYYLQKPDGGAWSDPEDVPLPYQASMKMLITPEGEAHIFGIANYLYYVHRTTDGAWSDMQQISSRTVHMYTFALDSQGTPHAVWDEGQDEYSENLEIIYAHQKTDGNWTSPQKIATDIVLDYHLVLGIDNQDIMHLVWDGSYTTGEIYNDIYYQQKTPDGSWTGPLNVSNTVSSSSDPNLALTGKGEVLVTWVDGSYPTGTPYYVWIIEGIPGSPDVLASAQANIYPPRSIYDGEGSIHILWAEGEEESAVYYHKGTFYATQDGDSWISQQVSLPVTMTQPVLSFLYMTGGVSSVEGAQAEVLLSSEGITSTLLSLDQNSPAWTHAWTDLSAWSGQDVTLTFHLSEVQGELLGSLKLDEVTIGQAHPDAWVEADGAQWGLPEEPFAVRLSYGNRGVVLAENSALTLTLPAGLSFVSSDPAPSQVEGAQVIWQLGDLPAGYTDGVISLMLEVDELGELGSWLSSQLALASQTGELELLNNIAEIKTYVGSLVRLPFAAK